MIVFENANSQDIPYIIDIENNSFPTPWTLEQFRAGIKSIQSVKEDGHIKGFICTEQAADETHILHMAVHPFFRRQGVGSKMIENILTNPSNKFFLEVRESNLGAQKLYEKYGFKVISKRKNYYQDNDEAALVMEYTKK